MILLFPCILPILCFCKFFQKSCTLVYRKFLNMPSVPSKRSSDSEDEKENPETGETEQVGNVAERESEENQEMMDEEVYTPSEYTPSEATTDDAELSSLTDWEQECKTPERLEEYMDIESSEAQGYAAASARGSKKPEPSKVTKGNPLLSNLLTTDPKAKAEEAEMESSVTEESPSTSAASSAQPGGSTTATEESPSKSAASSAQPGGSTTATKRKAAEEPSILIGMIDSDSPKKAKKDQEDPEEKR